MNVRICYFSGTGNTAMVAGMLAEAFTARGATASPARIEELLKPGGAPDLSDCDVLGIGYPILGLDAPRLIARFIATLPPGGGRRAFVFTTGAEDVAINHGAAVGVTKALTRRGYDVCHTSLVVMPPYWLVRYPDEVNKGLYLDAIAKTARIAGEIIAADRRYMRLAPLWRALLGFVKWGEETVGSRTFGRGLTTTAACTRCDRCVRDCPHGNIRVVGERVRFGWNCGFCMRCIYACPAGAIKARLFGFVVIKDFNGGARLRQVASDPTIIARPFRTSDRRPQAMGSGRCDD